MTADELPQSDPELGVSCEANKCSGYGFVHLHPFLTLRNHTSLVRKCIDEGVGHVRGFKWNKPLRARSDDQSYNVLLWHRKIAEIVN
jgi:hypothetical protein